MLPTLNRGWQDQGVTMPVHEDEAPRLAEIGRQIAQVGQNLSDFRSEVRFNFSEMVRKETYVAERDALKERIVSLEQRSRVLQGAFIGVICTVIAAVIVAWVTRGGT